MNCIKIKRWFPFKALHRWIHIKGFNSETWRVYAWMAITQDYGLIRNPKEEGQYNGNLHSLSVPNPQLSFNMSNCHSNTPRKKKINTKNSSLLILPYGALTKLSLRRSNIPNIRYCKFFYFNVYWMLCTQGSFVSFCAFHIQVYRYISGTGQVQVCFIKDKNNAVPLLLLNKK